MQIEFFHQPVLVNNNVQPLQDLNVVFSNYTGSERDYFEALGATVTGSLIRQNNPVLVCLNREGKKYSAAIEWGRFN